MRARQQTTATSACFGVPVDTSRATGRSAGMKRFEAMALPFRLKYSEEASLGLAQRLQERRKVKLAGTLGSTHQRRRLDMRESRDACRQPPVPTTEHRHQRRHQNGTLDRGVDEDRDGEAEAELLQSRDPSVDEARESSDHDDRGRGDDPPRALEPVGDGVGVVEPGIPPLSYARDKEDLVVHREPEQQGEEEDGDPTFDLVEAIQTQRSGTDAPAKEDDE